MRCWRARRSNALVAVGARGVAGPASIPTGWLATRATATRACGPRSAGVGSGRSSRPSPTSAAQRRRPGFDTAAYRERNQVERTFNRLKQYRRVATRYEKRANNYKAIVTIAMILLWL